MQIQLYNKKETKGYWSISSYEERKNYVVNKIKEGSIFYDECGGQVYFYQVTKIISKKTIEVMRINKQVFPDDEFGQEGYVYPLKDNFISFKPIRKRIGEYGMIRTSSFSSAILWEEEKLRYYSR